MLSKTNTSNDKTLAKISFVSAGNIFNAMMGFAFLAVVARFLDTGNFGKYAVLVALLMLVTRIMDFGTNSIFVSENIKSGDDDDILSFYSLKVVLFIVCLVLGFIGLSVFKLLTLPIYAIFVVGLAAYTTNFTLYALFQREQKFNLLLLVNTLPALIKLIFAVLVFTKIITLSLTGFFLVFCVSVLSDIVFISVLPKKYRRFRFTNDFIAKFKQAISPGISQLIYESWSTINNGLIKFATQFTNVGIFTIANKIASIFSLIAFSIFTVILPKNAERKRDKLTFDYKNLAVFGGSLALLGIAALVFSNIFVRYFFGEKYLASLPLLNILIVASAFAASQNVLESFFFVESQTKYMIRTSLIKLCVLVLATMALGTKDILISVSYANLMAAIAGVAVTVLFIKKVQVELN